MMPVEGIPTEEVITPAEVEKIESDPLASKFGHLARKEKDITNRMLALKKQEEDLKLKSSQYETDYIPKNKLLENPIQALTEMGLSYDKITELMLNQPPGDSHEIMELRKELKALRAAQDEQKSTFEESQSRAYQQAVKQISSEVVNLVENDSAYDTIKETDSMDAVTEYIERVFNTEGKLLSVKEACDTVEEYLLQEALKMAGLKKVKEKLSPLEKAVEEQKVAKKQAVRPTTTLTNQLAQTPSKSLTAQDRRARAIALLEGKQI